MEEQLKDIAMELEKIYLNGQPLNKELFLLGSDYQRIVFFSNLRNLIQEKDIQNDELAANILGWAYEKLSN